MRYWKSLLLPFPDTCVQAMSPCVSQQQSSLLLFFVHIALTIIFVVLVVVLVVLVGLVLRRSSLSSVVVGRCPLSSSSLPSSSVLFVVTVRFVMT